MICSGFIPGPPTPLYIKKKGKKGLIGAISAREADHKNGRTSAATDAVATALAAGLFSEGDRPHALDQVLRLREASFCVPGRRWRSAFASRSSTSQATTSTPWGSVVILAWRVQAPTISTR